MEQKAQEEKSRQGQRANRAGQAVNDEIAVLLHGTANLMPGSARTLTDFEELFRSPVNAQFAGVYAHSVRLGIGAFKCPFRPDFLVQLKTWPTPCSISKKSQDKSGSAKDKILRICDDVAHTSAAKVPALIVLTGRAMLEDEGVRYEVDYQLHRADSTILCVFFGMDEFRAWCLDGLPYPTREQHSFA